MNQLNKSIIFSLALAVCGCADDGDMKGTITLSVTDAPIDADQVRKVNMYISSVEVQSGSDWKSLKSFEIPSGINLMEYSAGSSYRLIDQYVDPVKITALRFNINLSDPTSSLIRTPECNVVFANGDAKPIYFYEAGVSNFVVVSEMNVTSRGHVDFTFDFDLRKSLLLDDQGNYIFKPVVRAVLTATAGNIHATVSNNVATDRLVVFAYSTGQYASSETNAPAAGEVRFPQAITSSKIVNNQFGLGFLPAGTYDLVFAKHSESGEFLTVLGRFNNVTVTAAQTIELGIDLTQLSGS